MTTPKKLEILRKAKGIALERQVRSGLPAVTPSEQELKETGVFQEAKLDLMRVDQEALSEQRRYLEEMAGDLRLKIIPQKGLVTLRKATGLEWTNGWTKHERKPTAKLQKQRDPIIHRMTREVRKLPSVQAVNIPKIKVPSLKPKKRTSSIPEKTKKRTKSHVERSGKTMRKLRHVNGVKVFAFPDDVWKIRKPRKRRRK